MSGSDRIAELLSYFLEARNTGSIPSAMEAERQAREIANDLDAPIRWRPIAECKVYRALVTNGHVAVPASRSDDGRWHTDDGRVLNTVTHFAELVLPKGPDHG